jgi:hypothetical protein
VSDLEFVHVSASAGITSVRQDSRKQYKFGPLPGLKLTLSLLGGVSKHLPPLQV